jgi:Alkylmercury lyase
MMTELEARVRLHVYERVVASGSVPSPLEVAERHGLAPFEAEEIFRSLQDRHHALVLLPASPYLWMAEPFSAVPTSYLVRAGERAWFGNCAWDALAILALVGVDGSVSTRCPMSGVALEVEVRRGQLVAAPGLVHFAVPASRWWESIGYT